MHHKLWVVNEEIKKYCLLKNKNNSKRGAMLNIPHQSHSWFERMWNHDVVLQFLQDVTGYSQSSSSELVEPKIALCQALVLYMLEDQACLQHWVVVRYQRRI